MNIKPAKSPSIAITLDIDWAPDWVIKYCLNIFQEHGVKVSFFATHETELNQKILDNNHELGIHPNFLTGSSHGNTPHEVLSFCKSLVPSAVSSRSHSLMTSEPILEMMTEKFGIKNDCSIYLPDIKIPADHKIKYSQNGPELTRIPHYFQDNMIFFKDGFDWKMQSLGIEGKAYFVFNFHPIHIVLNSNSVDAYNKMKEEKGLGSFTEKSLSEFRNSEIGTEDLLLEILTAFTSNHFVGIDELSKTLGKE